MSVYQDNGYANRKEYLAELAEEFDADKVYNLAALLGSEEDFDGLLVALRDDAETFYW